MRPASLSASNLHAASLCAGKVRMEKGLADTPREDAARGTMLHPYFMSGKAYDKLSLEDEALMRTANYIGSLFVEELMTEEGLTDKDPDTIEHEIELNGLVPGHPDLVFTWNDGDHIAILDLKTGMNDVEEAPSNWQLAAYAALLWQRKPFLTCAVAIIQPNALGKRVTTATYTAKQMPGVLAAIKDIYDATQAPDAPLIAGEVQCQFCRAKLVCPAYKAKYAAIEIVGQRAVATLSNDELERVYQAIQFANKIASEVRGEVRTRIEADDFPGWDLKNTGTERTVHDPLGMWCAFADHFQDNPKFIASAYDACREISWGKLENFIKAITGLTAQKAKELVKQICAPFVIETEKAKTPKRDK